MRSRSATDGWCAPTMPHPHAVLSRLALVQLTGAKPVGSADMSPGIISIPATAHRRTRSRDPHRFLPAARPVAERSDSQMRNCAVDRDVVEAAVEMHAEI